MGVKQITHEERKAIHIFVDKELPVITGAAPFGSEEAPVRVIAGFITRMFPSIRAQHLQQAFDLGAALQLMSGNKPVDINMYGKPLSTELVGRVLYAYIEHIKNAPSVSRLAASRPVAEPVQKPTGQEMYEGMLEIIANEGDMPIAYPFELIHGYMVEQNILRELPPQKAIPPVLRRRGLEHLAVDFSGHDRYKVAIRDHMLRIGAIEPKTQNPTT